MRPRPTVLLRIAAAALITACAGCGPSEGKVSGKVSFNGKTVVWGSVIMIDRNGGAHQGQIDLQGNYEIDNVPVGGVKIAVTSPNPEGRGGSGGGAQPKVKTQGALEDPREKFMAGKQQDPGLPKPPPGAWFKIPEKYYNPDTSELTGEVTGKVTVIDIDLK